jgi:biotin carboxyl carrier protein
MYFEAKVNQTPYKVVVEELRSDWLIKVQVSTDDLSSDTWKEYMIPKKNFTVAKDGNISLIFKDSSYLVDIVKFGTDYEVYSRGSYRNVSIVNDEILLRESIRGGGALGGQNNLKAGMPGKIVKVFVKEGQEVKADEPLLIMEAMKMENEMRAANDCIIDHIYVNEGDNVETSAALISFRKPN